MEGFQIVCARCVILSKWKNFLHQLWNFLLVFRSAASILDSLFLEKFAKFFRVSSLLNSILAVEFEVSLKIS